VPALPIIRLKFQFANLALVKLSPPNPRWGLFAIGG
jgi:hypothetical protein